MYRWLRTRMRCGRWSNPGGVKRSGCMQEDYRTADIDKEGEEGEEEETLPTDDPFHYAGTNWV